MASRYFGGGGSLKPRWRDGWVVRNAKLNQIKKNIFQMQVKYLFN